MSDLPPDSPFPPDSPMADLVSKIDEFGWAIRHVSAGEGPNEVCFSYTIGLTALGHPEIVIQGLPFESAQAYLNLAGSLIRDEGMRFEHGTMTDEFVGPGAAVVFITAIDDSRLTAVQQIYGSVNAVQLIYPDSRGRLPWIAGYANPPGAQPFLGIVPEGIAGLNQPDQN